MDRQSILDLLAQRIVAVNVAHPIRVAIDGIDAAGKTTLADELVHPIESQGRPVILASIDGFHRPRAERYRQGKDSPRGYYEDSFDYPSVREQLLLPLGPGGSRRYQPAAFDYRTDVPVSAVRERAPDQAVLLFDGIFLLRPELDDLWEYRIFVDVAFEVALRRALVRDRAADESAASIEERYRRRYFPAQRWYLDAVRPRERADVVVENDDPARPRLMFRLGGEGNPALPYGRQPRA